METRWRFFGPSARQRRGTLAPMPTPPTGTITFLFTDIAGSTRLWEEHASAMQDAVARHDELVRRAIENAGGYVFTTAGDGFGAAFSDARGALIAALDAQRSLATEPLPVPELRVRMGLHTGVAQERGGDYFGPSVNRAARIADAGHGGQVLVGRATADLVRGNLPENVELRDLGEHRLKDLGSPEVLYQLVADSLPVEAIPLRTLDSYPNNLPMELSSFIGRKRELAEVREHMRRGRLVTLTGVGGSGKTRLALATAAELLGQFPDGVWLVELAPLTDPRDLPVEVAETLGLEWRNSGETGAADRRSALEAIVEFLRERTALLVFDNCEHLIAGVAELAAHLLHSCRELRVLATSREGLGVGGEHLVQVPSLGLPSSLGLDEDRGYPDAMELFAERAAAVTHFVLDDATAHHVAEICRRLDGMPLAIELAAARVRMLNVEQVSERLSDAFRLLTGGARTALPRQQTLLATVDWSYQLLDERERRAFERLSVFRGGFSLEAAEAVISGDGVDRLDVFDLVASLVDKSMVEARAESGRFGLLETLRQYGLQKLADSGDADRWRERHLEHFLSVAEAAHAGTRSAEQVAWFDRLDADHENLKAALRWAREHGRVEEAARISNGLWWFWGMRGHVEIGLRNVRALAERDDLPVALRAGLLTGRAYLELEGGDIPASLPAGEEAVELARAGGDPFALSLALIYWANTAAHNFGRWEEAHAAYAEGYEIARGIESDWLMGWHALNEGWIYRFQGDREASSRLLELAAGHFRKAGNPVGIGWAATGLGALYHGTGDDEAAVARFEQGIAAHRLAGNRAGASFALFGLASALSHLGRHEEAIARALEGRAALSQITRNFDWGPVMARVYRRVGDLGAAVEVLVEFAAESEITWADFMVTEGLLATDLGRYDLAAPLLAFGRADIVRDGSEMPPRLEEDRRAAWERMYGRVADLDRVEAEWAAKSLPEAPPFALAALEELRSELTVRKGADGTA